ncbi:hypothetical protein [uncultured Maribacter sp.]|uniref:hypothetical protein n=1 Tax=uncultured Maribacter sp. TaxID=431308 RepID=UPI00261670F0|nr:hypothetical protein [uncultured Maribacter sp.]
MIFEELHSKIYAIAAISDEDTFMKVIPRKNKRNFGFGNIPKNDRTRLNKKTISTKAIQLSLFN